MLTATTTTTTTSPSSWTGTYHRLKCAEVEPLDPASSTLAPEQLQTALSASVIPASVSRESTAYDTIVVEDTASKKISCWIYHSGDAVGVSTVRSELAAQQALKLESERIELEYELASRSLFALESVLFYELGEETRKKLGEHRIRNFASIRYARRDRAKLVGELSQDGPADEPTELDQLVEDIWWRKHVALYHPLIAALEAKKKQAGRVRNPAAHPAPTKAQFVQYATSLPHAILPYMQEKMRKRRHWVAENMVDLFADD